MRRDRMISEYELLGTDQLEHEVEWTSHLDKKMSDYDAYLLLLDDGPDSDYLSSYCSVQRPEYHKVQ